MSTTTRPTIVCLCGSTRFWRTFQAASLTETLAGRIVLSLGSASGTNDYHFWDLDDQERKRVEDDLHQLHLRKIDLADEVLIICPGGYVGETTAEEIEYAKSLGKPIRYFLPERPADV